MFTLAVSLLAAVAAIASAPIASSSVTTSKGANGRVVTHVTVTSFRPGTDRFENKIEAVDAGLRLGSSVEACQTRHCAFVVYQGPSGYILSNIVEGDLDEFDGVEAALGESIGAFVQLYPPAGRYFRGLPNGLFPGHVGAPAPSLPPKSAVSVSE